MKVFMLGWEFPPMVSGGLGVACYGLAKALNGLAIDVLFVLPKPRARRSIPPSHSNGRPTSSNGRAAQRVKNVQAPSVAEVHQAVEEAIAHAAGAQTAGDGSSDATHSAGVPPASLPAQDDQRLFPEHAPKLEEHAAMAQAPLQRVTFVPIDAWLQPHMTATQYMQMVVEDGARHPSQSDAARWVGRAVAAGAHGPAPQPPNQPAPQSFAATVHARSAFADDGQSRTYIDEPAHQETIHGRANTTYAGDLFSETQRYARLAVAVARGEKFAVIHAHDWMTFEAAMAVAAASHKPLVVQIHSTELDRAGAQANAHIMEIERQGMNAADAVIAVSYRTKTQLIEKYGIDPRKIEVVYNATDAAGDAVGRRRFGASGRE